MKFNLREGTEYSTNFVARLILFVLFNGHDNICSNLHPQHCGFFDHIDVCHNNSANTLLTELTQTSHYH